MADKRFSLSGKNYPAAKGGMVHKGAQGTAEDFKRWLGDEAYKKANKSNHLKEVKETAKRGPKKATAAAASKDEGGDGGADEGDTGGSATGGAQRA